MLRSTRVIASLLRSLALGGAFVGTAAASSTLIVGCTNENQPEYWVKKLDDAAWRPRAVNRLAQFFEDSMSKSEKDLSNPEVKALVEKLVAPLSDLYVNQYDNLDEKTREGLINLLASFKDERTAPALTFAFEEFGKRGRGGKDIRSASRTVRDLKLKSAAPAVFAAFLKTKPSTKEGAYYRDLNEALLAVADPSWEAQLVPLLDQEFPSLQEKSESAVADYRDALYQTITAIQLLGELGAASAVVPLIKVILDPGKADAGNEALLALTKIGKPSVDATVKLLQDQDPDLAQFHQRRLQKASGADKPPGGNPHVGRAAIILGALGRSEAIKPMLAALENAKDDGEKAQFMMTLSMLPHTPEVKEAFTTGLNEMPKDATINGTNALQALSEPATLFFDPAMATVLVERAKEMKSKDDAVGKSLLALAAIKVMDSSNVAAVGALVKSLPKGEGALAQHLDKVRKGFELTSKLLEACNKDVACYTAEARKSDNQGDNTQLIAVKALYMVGILGDASSAAALVDAFPEMNHGALRYVGCQVIDHHHPSGSKELAQKLQDIVDKNSKSMDRDVSANDKPLRDALYRLRARAS